MHLSDKGCDVRPIVEGGGVENLFVLNFGIGGRGHGVGELFFLLQSP